MHRVVGVKKGIYSEQAEISQNTGRGQNNRKSNRGEIRRQSQRVHRTESITHTTNSQGATERCRFKYTVE